MQPSPLPDIAIPTTTPSLKHVLNPRPEECEDFNFQFKESYDPESSLQYKSSWCHQTEFGQKKFDLFFNLLLIHFVFYYSMTNKLSAMISIPAKILLRPRTIHVIIAKLESTIS